MKTKLVNALWSVFISAILFLLFLGTQKEQFEVKFLTKKVHGVVFSGLSYDEVREEIYSQGYLLLVDVELNQRIEEMDAGIGLRKGKFSSDVNNLTQADREMFLSLFKKDNYPGVFCLKKKDGFIYRADFFEKRQYKTGYCLVKKE